MSSFINLEGRIFGKLLVLSRAENNKNKKAQWNVICDCGTRRTIVSTSLISGGTQSCGCLQKERASESNRVFDSNPALRKLIDSYRNSAKRRGHNFFFSVEEADKLFQQPCFYCGAPPHRIFTEYNGKYKYAYNGIDRVDNSKDYTIDNIYTCCKDCNYAKNEMSTTEFSNWIVRVYEHFAKNNQTAIPGERDSL